MEISKSISQEIIDKAIVYANDTIDYGYNRFGFDRHTRINMIIVGTIGELIFQEYLHELKIEHDMEFQSGDFDDKDFLIKDKIIEIKTSGFTSEYKHLNLLYSEDQYQRALTKYDYCVQIFINGMDSKSKLVKVDNCNVAKIVGFVDFPSMKMYKQSKKYHGDDYKIPLNHLRNMDNFTNI